MAIKQESWGTVFTGSDVNAFALLALHSALGLECKGITVKRGCNAYRTVKSTFGLRGSKQKVYEQFTKILQDNGLLKD